MIRMNDIYMVADSFLLSRNYWELENADKLEQIDLILRTYLATKLIQLEPQKTKIFQKLQTMPVSGLIQMLEYQIAPEERTDSLGHIIHYILNIASNLQGYVVVWQESNDPKYQYFPMTTFNENGMWDVLITHKKTSYVEIYNMAYSALQKTTTRIR